MAEEGDDFAQRGFLGTTAVGWIRVVRRSNREWFALVEEMNTVMMTGIDRLHGDIRFVRTAPSVAIRLMMRAAGAYQAAALLIERGMVIEARVQLRTVVEAAICLRALKQDSGHFLERLIEDHDASAFRTSLTLLGLDEVSAEIKADAAMAKKVNKGRDPLDFRKLSTKGDALGIYLMYQRLSHTAAHVTMQSLEHHIEYDDAQKPCGLQWGCGTNFDIEGVLRLLVLSTLAIWESGVAACGQPGLVAEMIPYRNRAHRMMGEPIPDDEADPAT